jgi:hypothetical protein
MPSDPPIWDDIRHAFEHSDETVWIIARRYCVSPAQISYRAKKDQWTPRPSGAEALKIASIKRRFGLTRPSYAEPLAAPEHKAARSRGSLSHRKALIRRLYDIIDAKIAEMDRRIKSDRTLDLADAERETRDIGNQIKNFEKLTEIADAAEKSAQPTAADSTPDDTERLCEEIVQRFERLQRTAGAASTARELPTE